MEQATQARRYELVYPGIPLAVYREIVAHLRQVDGVDAGLTSLRSEHFDYHQSQVGSLWIHYVADLNPICQEQVEKILAYYSSRFGAWNRSSAEDITG